MNRYRDAFETLAERGSPLGAQALLERIKGTSTTSTAVPAPAPAPRHRLSGPVVAVAVFAVVLLAGVPLLLLRPSGTGTEMVDPTDTVWREFPEDVMGFAAGPGGFIGHAYHSGSSQIVFSSDGVTWTPVEFPREPDYEPPPMAGPQLRMAVANETLWLGIGPENEVTWTSTNGRDWSLVEVPEELATRFRDVAAGGEVFLATISDPFDELPPTLWRLGAEQWERNTPVGFPEASDLEDGHLEIAGGGAGFVAVLSKPDGSFATWASDDGSVWTPGVPVEAPEPNPGQRGASTWVIDMPGGWMALNFAFTDGATMIHVRTSTDGLQWQLQPDPPFSYRSESFFEVDGALTGIDGQAAWLTRDGATWERLRTFDPPVMWALATTVDGQTVVLYESEETANESPDTTIVMGTPFEEPKPDPAGTALQDEILADGVDTRAEYETAVAAMVACMEDRGAIVDEWSIDPNEDVSTEYSGADADTAFWFCHRSYVDRLAAALMR